MNKLPTKLLLTTCLMSSISNAQTFNSLNFDFSEAAFTAGTLSGTNGFNILDDVTGAKLGSDNGDLDDFFIEVISSIPSNADGAVATLEILAGGELRSSHGYNKTFANTYTSGTGNNPGSVIKQTIRMTFASHVAVSNFTTDFRSLNTRGRTWEHSELTYLKPDGSYFTSAPVVGDYLTWEAVNQTQPGWNIGAEGPGSASGSPSEGWFVAASTATVKDVGTNLTAIGLGNDGSKENLTSTNGNSILDYNDVGLAANTEIGGFEWSVYVEDTRGIDNNHSSWSSTQTFFEITGEVGSVPEPSSTLLLGLGGIAILLRRQK